MAGTADATNARITVSSVLMTGWDTGNTETVGSPLDPKAIDLPRGGPQLWAPWNLGTPARAVGEFL
jgi:hypothetical protein